MSAEESCEVWRVAAASAVGTSHLAEGVTCQDAFACELFLGGRALCAAVSDGAGSAAMSGVGAEIASATFVSLAGEHLARFGGLDGLTREVVDLWIGKIQTLIEMEAARAGKDVREYACTLLGVIAHEGRLATFQIGDGAIVVGDEGCWRFVYWPQHGEYANQTFFVTELDAWESLQFDLTEMAFDEIGIFSDGLERLLLHHEVRAVHGPFFESMMPSIRNATTNGLHDRLSQSLRAYLTSKAINSRTDDDTSLVLATRRRRLVLQE